MARHVVVCGDFNADEKSVVYVQNELTSAFARREPVTFFTKSIGRKCMDYIFVSEAWEVRRLGDVPVIPENVFLPCPAFPSDHIPICASLGLRKA